MQIKQMNITFLITNELAGTGGVESVLINITKSLKLRNITSNIVILVPPKNEQFLNNFENVFIAPKIHFFLKNQLPNFIRHPISKFLYIKKSDKFLKKIFSSFTTDAIFILSISKNFFNIIPSLKYIKTQQKIPIIAWPHGTLNTLSPKELARFKNEHHIFDALFAISRGIQKEFHSIAPKIPSYTIYNPIPNPLKIPSRKNNEFIIMARIEDPNKGIRSLLKMMSTLTGNWHLTILGGLNEPIYINEFKTFLQEINIENKVTYYGWKKAPWDYISSAGVLLLNSVHEGMPMCLLEAIIRGIPCISSDCPTGPREIIKNNINGWLYNVGDLNTCKSLLQNIIDGKLKLPTQESVIQSAQRFSEDRVLNNFIHSLNNVIQYQKRSYEK